MLNKTTRSLVDNISQRTIVKAALGVTGDRIRRLPVVNHDYNASI
jgi:hypothetical protein